MVVMTLCCLRYPDGRFRSAVSVPRCPSCPEPAAIFPARGHSRRTSGQAPFLPTFFLPASPQTGRPWRSNRQFCNRFAKKQGVKCKKFPLNRSVRVRPFHRSAGSGRAGSTGGRRAVRTFSTGCGRLRRPGDDVFNQMQQPLFSLRLLFDSQYPYPVFYIIITYPHSFIVDRIVIGH